jgi:CheY-like chemotaxis protein
MTPEELEDTVEFSQQMVQVLLETIGEGLATIEQLRKENRGLRAVIEEHGWAEAAPAMEPASGAPPAGSVLSTFTVRPDSPPVVVATSETGALGSDRRPAPLYVPALPGDLKQSQLLGEIYEETPLLESAEDALSFTAAARQEVIPEGMEYVPLWVDPEPSFALPDALAPVEAAPAETAPPAPPVEYDLLSHHLPLVEELETGLGQGVLLIEDSRVLQLRLRSIITALGYAVTGAAASGAEGVAQVRARTPRAAIIDYHIDGGDPANLLTELRVAQPGLRLIVCTPDMSPQVRSQLASYGCHEVLAKPIQLDHFVRALRRCMDDAPLA